MVHLGRAGRDGHIAGLLLDIGVVSADADLESAVSVLDQIVERISKIADELATGSLEDIAADLYESERILRSGTRRLERSVRNLRRRR
ncbi:MAG: hypothetical protein JJLCMIEE_02660 [Acidimicrobiales bacterium]|nr:hypothetical protein [Acidimicrobiales bacterium]